MTVSAGSALTWFGPNWTLLTSDAVGRDLAGRVVNEVVDGVDHHAGNDYSYDGAGRLVEAWVPGATYRYEFAENGFCVAPGAHRNGNRTVMTVTAPVPSGLHRVLLRPRRPALPGDGRHRRLGRLRRARQHPPDLR